MVSFSKLKNKFGVILLFIGDIITIFSIFYVSVFLRKHVIPFFLTDLPGYQYDLATYLWILPVWLIILTYEEGYSKRFSAWDEVRLLWKSAFFSSIAIFSMLFIMKRGQDYSRILIITMTAVSLVIFPILRLYIKQLLYAIGLMRRKVLIIGSGESAINAYKGITQEPNLGYDVAGFIDDSSQITEIFGIKVRLGIAKVERYIKSAAIHDVLIAKPEMDKASLTRLINRIQHKAENTLYIPDINGIAVSGTELRHFFKEQTIIIEVKNNLASPLIYAAKRFIDYIAGLCITLIFLPLMLGIAATIRLDSRGPSILRQKRIGKRGKEFYCYKFRTMCPDAEEALKRLLESDTAAKEEYEKYWKLTNDPRITRVGGFLRRTSLDELPQILNVIKGEMSLIGPRPYLPREWQYIKEESPVIHALPPGITGLWQVSGRNNQNYNFRITMDSWYVKNWNLWLDVMIFLKTIGVVIKRDGAH